MNDTEATIVVYVFSIAVTCAGIAAQLYFGKKAVLTLLHGKDTATLRAQRWGERTGRWLIVIGLIAAMTCMVGFVPVGMRWAIVSFGVNACTVVLLLVARRKLTHFAFAKADEHANGSRTK